MSLLNQKVYKPLELNKKYSVQLMTFREVETSKDPYVELTFETNEGQVVKINAFERQLNYIAKELIKYYVDDISISVADLLKGILEDGLVLTMTKYISTSSTGVEYTNYSFNPNYKPLDTEVPASAELPFA